MILDKTTPDGMFTVSIQINREGDISIESIKQLVELFKEAAEFTEFSFLSGVTSWPDTTQQPS